MVVPDARRLGGESTGVEPGEEDHQGVEERSLPVEAEYLVSDQPESEHSHEQVYERHGPDEPGRRAHRGEDALVSRLAVVERQPTTSGEQDQCGDDDPLASEEVEEVSPEVQ